MPNTIASTDVGGTGLATVGTNGQVLTSNGTTLSYQTPSAGTSFSGGTTGLTPNTATTGTVTLAGTLNVASGGTNATSAAAALTSLGAYPASNPSSFTNNILSAGTGISVSASTGASTISNAGVTSVVAGSGISVSASTGGITITNTAPSSGQTVTNTGGSPPYYGLRAWVNFYGTGASIFGAVNVSSISRTNTGTYTINFTTAMPDANYACAGLAQRDIGYGGTDIGIIAYPPGNGGTQLSSGSFNVFTCDQGTNRRDSYCVTLMVAR